MITPRTFFLILLGAVFGAALLAWSIPIIKNKFKRYKKSVEKKDVKLEAELAEDYPYSEEEMKAPSEKEDRQTSLDEFEEEKSKKKKESLTIDVTA